MAVGADVAGPTLDMEVATWCRSLDEIADFLHGAGWRHLAVVVVGGDVVSYGKDDFESLLAEARALMPADGERASAAGGYRIWRENR